MVIVWNYGAVAQLFQGLQVWNWSGVAGGDPEPEVAARQQEPAVCGVVTRAAVWGY